MKKSQYEKFLEILVSGEMLIGQIALEMQIVKRNMHRLIKEAEAHGLKFTKTKENGGLYSIQIEPESWQMLRSHIVRKIQYSGRKIWGFDDWITSPLS